MVATSEGLNRERTDYALRFGIEFLFHPADNSVIGRRLVHGAGRRACALVVPRYPRGIEVLLDRCSIDNIIVFSGDSITIDAVLQL